MKLSRVGQALLCTAMAGAHVFAGQTRIVDVATACPTRGRYDQTCWQAAISKAQALPANGSGIVIISGPQTYTFSGPLELANVSNLTLEGAGSSTKIVSAGGDLIKCAHCSQIVLTQLDLSSSALPTVVSASMLPTPSPTTLVVIDRSNTGNGYIPTVNDQDIQPPPLGPCRS